MSALHTLPIPFVNPDDMQDTGAQIAAFAEQYPQFATIEEYWRNPAPFDAEIKANRERAHAHFDRHRDAALIAAGLIDAPVARTQESF